MSSKLIDINNSDYNSFICLYFPTPHHTLLCESKIAFFLNNLIRLTEAHKHLREKKERWMSTALNGCFKENFL